MRDEIRDLAVSAALLEWYDIHARTMPWRTGPADRAGWARWRRAGGGSIPPGRDALPGQRRDYLRECLALRDFARSSRARALCSGSTGPLGRPARS